MSRGRIPIEQITTEDLIATIVGAGYSGADFSTAGTVADCRAEYDRRTGKAGAWETAPGMLTRWGARVVAS